MDGKTKVYDLKTATTTITIGSHINVVACACFSPDERWLATASWDRSCKVWDISTGIYRMEGPLKFDKDHEGSVASCSFNSDGTLLVTGSYDRTVCLWNLDSKSQVLRLLGHDHWVLDAGISKDDKWLLSASADHTLRLWDIEDSDNMSVLHGGDQKKNAGVKVTTCRECGKPFGVSQGETGDLANICVFCLLHKRTFSIDLHLDENKPKDI
jgi:WD40 repeat protein